MLRQPVFRWRALAPRQRLAALGGAAPKKVLTTPGHDNKEYPLAAEQSYSFAEIAATLSELAGRPVIYTDVPPVQFAAQLAQAGVPAPFVDFILAFGDAITHGDFDRPSSVLTELLGRPLTSLKAYLQEAYFSG